MHMYTVHATLTCTKCRNFTTCWLLSNQNDNSGKLIPYYNSQGETDLVITLQKTCTLFFSSSFNEPITDFLIFFILSLNLHTRAFILSPFSGVPDSSATGQCPSSHSLLVLTGTATSTVTGNWPSVLRC